MILKIKLVNKGKGVFIIIIVTVVVVYYAKHNTELCTVQLMWGL